MGLSYRQKMQNDIQLIVERFRTDENVTMVGIRDEYHCKHAELKAAMLTQMSEEEYQELIAIRRKRAGVSTQFKKGHKSLKSTSSVGTISVRKVKNRKKMRMIKIAGTGEGKRRWKPYAVFVWEQPNGPIPEGMFPVHIDGNQLNDDISNLKLADRAGHIANMRRNNPQMYEKAVKSRAKNAGSRAAFREVSRELYGEDVMVIECLGCGFTAENATEQCPKCSSTSFDTFKQKTGLYQLMSATGTTERIAV